MTELFDTIYVVGKTIIDITKDDDVLLFIGQSPNLIYHVVKQNRESYELPFSGIYPRFKSVTKDKLIFFEKILLHYGITKNVIKKNIYLIDYCVSGESVASAGKILNKIFLQFKRYGLIYWTNSSLDIDNAHIFDKKIWLDKLIDVKHLNNLINFEYDFGFRTIPKFSFFKSYDDTFFEFKKYNSIDEIKNQLSI